MDTPIEKMRLVWTRTFSIALHLLFLTGLNCCCESFFVFCICGNDRTAVFYALLFSVICFEEETDAGPRSRRKPPALLFRYWGLQLTFQTWQIPRPRWVIQNLPVAKFTFAVYPVRILPSASETLADGKRFICRRQTKNLQSASAPLAIGKIHV